jgi:hypothetical protein
MEMPRCRLPVISGEPGPYGRRSSLVANCLYTAFVGYFDSFFLGPMVR